MNIDYISDFLEIAECGNFLEAADSLNISQSTLSKHIQSLEKKLGIELFDRTTRKVSLSPGGKLFLPFARHLEDTYYDLLGELKEFKSEHSQQLSIGCMPLMANYDVMKVVADFKMENPKTEFKLIEYNAYTGKGICESLLNFEFDLAFCDPATINLDQVETTHFISDHLVAMLPKDHPLAAEEIINIKLLSDQKLLLMDRTTPFYNMYQSLFASAGINPDVVFYGIRIENFIEMASKNMGIAILMKRHIVNHTNQGVVIRKIHPTFSRTFSFVRMINRHHSSVSKKFWHYIESLNQEKKEGKVVAP
jgi:DNA-binding transcriptional LysR family regulator